VFIEGPRYTERFGSVRINEVQKVVALDSGIKSELPRCGAMGVIKVAEDAIRAIEERMAIIIPVKDEKVKLFEGVVSGVPHDCLAIVVSNSQREKVDRFRIEKDALNQLCRFTARQALIIHQKDSALAEAAKQCGFSDIVGEDGLVRDGKSEGMVLGLLMAMAAGKDYVGFVDADNYFPGAVLEYVRCYAAGFSMAKSPYAMVRILWSYKSKMSASLYFRKWGRVSEITNKYLNLLISAKTGFETVIIRTGNAGEHAMSIKLAEILPYASGYAVEPQELISLFEGFGGVMPTFDPQAMSQGIDLFQIETRNPHMHEEKGAKHLQEMVLAGLSTIYHSPLCEEETRQMLVAQLASQKALKKGEEPPVPHINAPPRKADTQKFIKLVEPQFEAYYALYED